MTAKPLAAGIPAGPLVDPTTGEITPPWRALLMTLLLRTGASQGSSIADTTAVLAAETTARTNADNGLATSVETERAAREAADANLALLLSGETNQRFAQGSAAGDLVSVETAARIAADTAEATARAAADALLLPTASLRAAWEALNLSALPTSDPGFGLPWLNVEVMTVGSALSTLEIEDGTGHWELEDASGNWDFA